MSNALQVSGGSALSLGFGQIQRQQALRHARQLEAQAETLASQALSARKEANAADRHADDLETRAEGARSEASSARLNNTSAQGFDRATQELNAQFAQIDKAAGPESAVTYLSNASTSRVFEAKAGQTINEMI